MELLGIDKAYDVKREDRNWSGVREFFKQKIPELERLKDEGVDGNGIQEDGREVREVRRILLSDFEFVLSH